MKVNLRQCRRCKGVIGIPDKLLSSWRGLCGDCRKHKPITESSIRRSRIPKKIKGIKPYKVLEDNW